MRFEQWLAEWIASLEKLRKQGYIDPIMEIVYSTGKDVLEEVLRVYRHNKSPPKTGGGP